MDLKILEQRAKAFDHLFDAVVVTDPEGIITDWNIGSELLYGYTKEEAIGQPARIVHVPEDVDRVTTLVLSSIEEFGKWNGEVRYLHKDGRIGWLESMCVPIFDDNNQMIGALGINRDITARVEETKRLYDLAHYDRLTGLANRTHFMKALEKEILRSSKDKKELALLFLDLDSFKKINDTLGHFIGDKVIQTIGTRLKNVIRKEDMVARFGGDEFAIMLTSVQNDEDIILTSRRILKALKKPLQIDDHILHTFGSIGISRYPSDDTNANNLLQYADTAMYKVKDKNGDNFQFYTKQLTYDVYEDVKMEQDLRESLKNEDFEVYYQPQINIQSENITGIEALLRWNHPKLGLLCADNFIPLAEKTGLIVELGLWMMKTAIAEVSKWYHEGLKPGVLALNIGMKQLEYPNLLEEISNNLQENEFKEEWLELEITETEVMINPTKILSILEKLHGSGITIAIDDFGTGYSSLAHLKYLPIDKLKIDKSFIQDIPGDCEAEIIVKAMISLAKNLGLDVVAEGVENKAQKVFLELHSCSNIQGYFYKKPIKGKEMKDALHDIEKSGISWTK